MQLFRGPGFPIEPIRAGFPRFGATSRRRYGRLRAPVQPPAGGPGFPAAPEAPEEELFPWVDQEFEEYFYD